MQYLGMFFFSIFQFLHFLLTSSVFWVARLATIGMVGGSRPTPDDGRQCLGSPSLNGYRPLAGNLTAAEKGTGHPTSSCRLPSIMGAARFGLVFFFVQFLR